MALLLGSPAEATGIADETVQGRLVDAAGTAVEGVDVVVEESGREVGRATSDATGQWSVPVPAAGDYTVTLPRHTLPEESERFRWPDDALVDRSSDVLGPTTACPIPIRRPVI